MKALLRKDLYTTVGSLRMIFLIMAIFAVVTVFAENTGFYVRTRGSMSRIWWSCPRRSAPR